MPRAIFGYQPLDGVLVVERFAACNTVTGLCEALDALAENIDRNPCPLLVRTLAPGVWTQNLPASLQPDWPR